MQSVQSRPVKIVVHLSGAAIHSMSDEIEAEQVHWSTDTLIIETPKRVSVLYPREKVVKVEVIR